MSEEHEERAPMAGRTYKLPICGIEPGSLRLDRPWNGSVPDALLDIIEHNVTHATEKQAEMGIPFEQIQRDLPRVAAGVALRVMAVALDGEHISIDMEINEEDVIDPVTEVFGERNQG